MGPIYIKLVGMSYPIVKLFTQLTGMRHGSGSASHDEHVILTPGSDIAQ